ncbi:aldo/keto reductase [Sphingosinicella sp. BN140058]|uniref:aldo/keto reductase n=1 Tax=Sphingosinicella sp. BN140058 TaxID=1892855 RepID=UPI0010104A0D|nr:aldo/keto reductase [Sphingosinicella sp. BN140058]QAY75383.1 aldo/keto reductase [Sphingosinicella sp. BN140058]
MEQRKLGTLEVSAIGLGCMGFTAAYGGQDEAASRATLDRAVELGVTFFDTAEVYGPYENEEIVGRALRPVRDRVLIATKFGFAIGDQGVGFQRTTGLDGSPANARRVAEASLARLGVETIDLFYLHRPDPAVPIEESVGGMAELVREGKVRAIGLSEVSADQLRRAHAVHPIAALQSEYSLWFRDAEQSVLPVCRELGIGFVPYSPLGRGFLTGRIRSRGDLEQDDFRAGLPRFAEENMAANLALVDRLNELAEARGGTAAQLALAWVLAQGDDVVPIPGARKIPNLEANVAAVGLELSASELAAIGEIMTGVQGARYGEREMARLAGQR